MGGRGSRRALGRSRFLAQQELRPPAMPHAPCSFIAQEGPSMAKSPEHPEHVVVVATAENELEAGMMVAALEEAGIKATMSGVSRRTSASACLVKCRFLSPKRTKPGPARSFAWAKRTRKTSIGRRSTWASRKTSERASDLRGAVVSGTCSHRLRAAMWRNSFRRACWSGAIFAKIAPRAGEILSNQSGTADQSRQTLPVVPVSGRGARGAIRGGEPQKLQFRTVMRPRRRQVRAWRYQPCWTMRLRLQRWLAARCSASSS